MLGEIDESMVFVTTRTDDTNHGLPVLVRQSEIGPIAATARYLTDVGGLRTFPLLVEFYEFLHIACKDTTKNREISCISC
jgi:hypothetical protein